MTEQTRLLILGGTTEAAALAEAAHQRPGLRIVNSLAGRTRRPKPLPGETRVGGFGGAEKMADYLRDAGIDLVIDATHPFAAIISRNAAEACAGQKVPRLLLARPEWQRQPDDRWIEVDDIEEAAATLPNAGLRAFLTVGRNALRPFAGYSEIWFLARIIDPPIGPSSGVPALGNCEIIGGRAPFVRAKEAALMRKHRIDVLVSKNSGGAATYAKIAAARDLSLPVVMVRRPAHPAGPRVESVEDALAWLAKNRA